MNRSPMTERIYYNDSYLRCFNAQVVACAPGGSTVYLDRTAFYPTSGGQPCDLGFINSRLVPARMVRMRSSSLGFWRVASDLRPRTSGDSKATSDLRPRT